MRNLILILGVIFFLGCLQPPVVTPTPTPTIIETPQVTPAAPTPTPTPTPTITPEVEPVMYRIWMDSDFGFYRVRALKGNASYRLPSGFNILNFTVKVGDSVRWINDDSYDFPMTVASNEGLWTGRTGLTRYQTERFEYTFNTTGTYTFSIREYQRLKNQTITVVP